MPENDDVRITVVTVHYNSFEFIRLMYESFLALSRERFQMMICDNGSNFFHKMRLRKYFEGKPNVRLFLREQGHEPASYCHARGLDLLLAKVTTEYAVIMDSDCVFLAKNWDSLMINAMQSCEIIGTAAAQNYTGKRIGGYTFPLPFAMLLRMGTFRSLGVSFMPGDITLGQDTAWQLKEAYENKKLPWRVLEARNTREYKEGPFRDLIVAEFYFEGALIASHFGRGSTCGAAKYRGRIDIPILSAIFRRIRGNSEKIRWIKRCRDIIAVNSTTRDKGL